MQGTYDEFIYDERQFQNLRLVVEEYDDDRTNLLYDDGIACYNVIHNILIK